MERNVEMGIQKELNNYEASLVLRGIACCYAQFKVPLSWEPSVAVYPELVEGSLTCTVDSLLSTIMTDTPQHIRELQLKIWLSKSPAERLKQFLEDNEALFKFWEKAKKGSTITNKKRN